MCIYLKDLRMSIARIGDKISKSIQNQNKHKKAKAAIDSDLPNVKHPRLDLDDNK